VYRGMVPNIIGIIPYVGVNYLVYEKCKENASIPEGRTAPTPHYLALCGGIAGTTGVGGGERGGMKAGVPLRRANRWAPVPYVGP
jgi:hypothetical protein